MKKTINKQRRRIFIVISIIALIFIGIFSILIYTAVYNDVSTSSIIVPEYNDLFIKEAQSKLKLLVTAKSRNRETTSSYIYDRRFGIFVFKVVLSNYSGLKKIITYNNGWSVKFMNAVYSPLGGYNYEMDMNDGRSFPVSSITFKCSGDSIKAVAENDSLYCYYYKFNTFSIHYDDKPYDIIAKANRSNIPASVLFKKKGAFLYIILMTVEEGAEEMQPDLLYSIIKK